MATAAVALAARRAAPAALAVRLSSPARPGSVAAATWAGWAGRWDAQGNPWGDPVYQFSSGVVSRTGRAALVAPAPND